MVKTARVEKDNSSIKREIEELKVVSDEVLRAKVSNVHICMYLPTGFSLYCYSGMKRCLCIDCYWHFCFQYSTKIVVISCSSAYLFSSVFCTYVHKVCLKGQCQEIFVCWFFSSNSSFWFHQRFPGTIQIFSKNSRRYSTKRWLSSV